MIPTTQKLTRSSGKKIVDVYSELKTLNFKGVAMPCQVIDWEINKRIVEHSPIYHPGEILRNMGRGSQVLDYVVPLFQNAVNPKWNQGYSKIWPPLFKKLMEDTPGPLIDPMHGEIQVEFIRGRYSLSNEKGRSGIILELSFKETTEISDEPSDREISLDAAKLWAEEFETSYTKIIVDQPEMSSGTPLNVFSAVGIITTKAFRTVNKIEAYRDRYVQKVDRQVERISKLADYRNLPTERSGRQIARKIRDTASNGFFFKRKKVRIHTVQEDIAILALANLLGVTQEHLMEKNPSIADYPIVRRGTVVKYEEF